MIFSIPAAKKVNIVYANDLNPESYKWLVHNAAKNKESKEQLSRIHIHQHTGTDGRL
jgi:tRNA G37 N-methylase Trm5